ncbi:MAG: glycosyltransferase family 10 [Candidatus Omnitrophica bacterium]|nr:glycosyltransferase family 10 [Candidatus Omnitrophota bacterium]MCM8827888.1 glycosyltransferase family 10 [Candidatus Omnitrophota bacterium]
MRKATLFTESFYLNNKQFDLSDEMVNRDDCQYGAYLLRKRFCEIGIDLSTQDINPISESEFVIYNEFPGKKHIFSDKKNYLLIFECEVIRPDNWDVENHKYFKKIFTWHDGPVDNKKYIKLNFSMKIPEKLDFDLSKKNRLCAMIVANKSVRHPLELYSETKRAIDWFEENHPEDFDLYGFGWDRFLFTGYFRRLNRFDSLRRFFKPRLKTYRGSVKSKKETMSRYKFAICYENAKDIPGYITEKIFDCFFSGCVPVYLGAPNIADHIPPETFIDRRNFKNYEELYKFIKDMSETEYIEYLDAIRDFVSSDKIYPFSAECFAETLVREIVEKD